MLSDPQLTPMIEEDVSDNVLKTVSHVLASKMSKNSMGSVQTCSEDKAETASKMLQIMERLRRVDMPPNPN